MNALDEINLVRLALEAALAALPDPDYKSTTVYQRDAWEKVNAALTALGPCPVSKLVVLG
jgi:hypothetical protein